MPSSSTKRQPRPGLRRIAQEINTGYPSVNGRPEKRRVTASFGCRACVGAHESARIEALRLAAQGATDDANGQIDPESAFVMCASCTVAAGPRSVHVELATYASEREREICPIAAGQSSPVGSLIIR